MLVKKYSPLLLLLLVGCVSSPAYEFFKSTYTYEEEVYEYLTSTGDTCFDNVSEIGREYDKAAILLIEKNQKNKEHIQVLKPVGARFIFEQLRNVDYLPAAELEIAEKIRFEYPNLGRSPLFAYVNYACDRYDADSNLSIEKFDIEAVTDCVDENLPELFSYTDLPAIEQEVKQRRLMMSCFEAKGI